LEAKLFSNNIGITTKLLLIICSILLIQSSVSAKSVTTDTANASWTIFWKHFSTAIQAKDTAALVKMMPADFSDGGGGLNAGEWLQFINQHRRQGSWKDLQKSIKQGTKKTRNTNSQALVTRVTKDGHYYFEFRKDKKWWFAGVVGD
jgi:ribulose kinase